MAHPKLYFFPRRLLWRAPTLLLLAGSIAVHGQDSPPSKDPKTLGLGKFLVAARDLKDPGFAQTVIVLVQYDQTGTIGLVLNRRTEISISKALSELGPAAQNHPEPIYIGGPVDTSVVRALIRAKPGTGPAPQTAQHVLNDIYMIWQRPPLQKLLQKKQPPSTFRVYLGYCGWAKGQLENEIRAGAWYIFDAAAAGTKHDVFDADPDTFWKRAIAETERQLAYAKRF